MHYTMLNLCPEVKLYVDELFKMQISSEASEALSELWC